MKGIAKKAKKYKIQELELTVYGLQRDNAELVKMNRSLLIKCKELLDDTT